MLIIVFAVAVLICCAAVLAAGLKNALLENSSKTFAPCSFFLLAYVVRVYCLDTFIFQKAQESIISSVLYGLSGASNHFIMTLDILCLLSAFLIINFHRLKITELLPAMKAV